MSYLVKIAGAIVAVYPTALVAMTTISVAMRPAMVVDIVAILALPIGIRKNVFIGTCLFVPLVVESVRSSFRISIPAAIGDPRSMVAVARTSIFRSRYISGQCSQ